MPINKEELHLRDLIKVVKKRRHILLAFLLSVLALACLVTFVMTPLYEGTTKVMIQRSEGSDLTGSYQRNSFDPIFYETQFQLIRSRAVARRVVNTLSLQQNYDSFIGKTVEKTSPWRFVLTEIKNLFGWIRTAISPAESASQKEKGLLDKGDYLTKIISEQVRVRPVEGSRLVNISYLSPNPELAALIANTVAKAYIEETLDMKLSATRTSLQWMTKKAETEAEKLRQSELRLQQYMKDNNIVTVEDRMTVTPEKLSEINIQLVRAESRRKELEALYEKVKKIGRNYQAATTISAISIDPALRAIRAQIVETEKSIMELSNKYGSRHPLMVKARGDLRVLNSKRNQEIDRLVESIKNEYELALSNERSLRGQLSSTKTEALLLTEKFIQYGALKRVVDTNRKLYDALMLKLKEQSITEETSPVNLWIVEEAVVPLKTARPWVGMNLLFATVIGLFGGLGLILFLEYFDNTVMDPEAAEAKLGIPVLTVIEIWRDDHQKPEHVVWKDPQSVFAETYRSLRTSILLSFPDRPPKKILVTSSGMGEGKTTTSVNLAFALARSDKRVLLIEGDLRKPRLHKVLRIDNSKGLSSYLAGATDSHIIQKGPLPNLAVIPSGPIPPNPSELLSSNRMNVLLDSLSKEFDFIVCDSSPVLPVADSRVICSLFDGVILLSKAGVTPYDMLERARKQLVDSGARLLGLVINGFDAKKSGYYHQDYYYAYAEDKPKSPSANEG
jgi:capsular exopolysaccharide synthesis family protein